MAFRRFVMSPGGGRPILRSTLLPSTMLGLEGRDNCAFRCAKERLEDDGEGAVVFSLGTGVMGDLGAEYVLAAWPGVPDRSTVADMATTQTGSSGVEAITKLAVPRWSAC